MTRIKDLRIKGFRSLADVAMGDLPRAAVMIGPNGSGKSNVINFFTMLSWMTKASKLGDFVQLNGGANDQLFGGSKETKRIEARITMQADNGVSDYDFELVYGHPDRLMFANERYRWTPTDSKNARPWQHLRNGHSETRLREACTPEGAARFGVNVRGAKVIVHLLSCLAPYQFHDTSHDSPLKKSWDILDDSQLHSHGGNLAAVLYRLEQDEPERYRTICEHVKRVLPVFGGFALEERHGKVILRWKHSEHEQIIGAHLTSDGSFRFFALVTLLSLPPKMLPPVLLLDEPELGLHPMAIELIGGLIRSLSAERQVLVATQSPLLVNAFELDEVFVLNLHQGKTTIKRHALAEWRNWLDEYSLGQLWQKNLLGGRP